MKTDETNTLESRLANLEKLLLKISKNKNKKKQEKKSLPENSDEESIVSNSSEKSFNSKSSYNSNKSNQSIKSTSSRRHYNHITPELTRVTYIAINASPNQSS